VDRAIQRELTRLGLGDLTVHHEKTVLRSNGEWDTVEALWEVDLTDGEAYVRGQPAGGGGEGRWASGGPAASVPYRAAAGVIPRRGGTGSERSCGRGPAVGALPSSFHGTLYTIPSGLL